MTSTTDEQERPKVFERIGKEDGWKASLLEEIAKDCGGKTDRKTALKGYAKAIDRIDAMADSYYKGLDKYISKKRTECDKVFKNERRMLEEELALGEKFKDENQTAAVKSKLSTIEQRKLKFLAEAVKMKYPHLEKASDSYFAKLTESKELKTIDLAKQSIDHLLDGMQQDDTKVRAILSDYVDKRFTTADTINRSRWWSARDGYYPAPGAAMGGVAGIIPGFITALILYPHDTQPGLPLACIGAIAAASALVGFGIGYILQYHKFKGRGATKELKEFRQHTIYRLARNREE